MDKVKEILMKPNTDKMALQSEDEELNYNPETGEIIE